MNISNGSKESKPMRILGLFISTISVISLLGCSGLDRVNDEVPQTKTSSPNISAETDSSSSTPVPVLDDTNPLYKACNELISVEALYDFNPNFSYDASATPKNGSLGEIALTKSGTYCDYINLSSGENIELSVSQISNQSLKDWVQKLHENSRVTEIFDLPAEGLGFFSRKNNEGVAQVMIGNTWIVISSTSFYIPEDTISLMSVVVNSLSR